MALLGAYIDQRTNAAINSNSSTTFAHGLPATPDLVCVRENVSSASSVSAVTFTPLVDATNVSIYNSGERNSTTLQITTLRFHSAVR